MVRKNKKNTKAVNTLNGNVLNKMFSPKYTAEEISNRPESSFEQLMRWSNTNFVDDLDDSKNITNLMHNRISIDESFISYANENNIKIECLYKDAVLSWKDDNDGLEKFLAQGAFKVHGDGFEFLHSALLHKGVNNEDEVSFFITCSSNNFDKYLNIRNDYDTWVKAQDRGNDQISVIGSDNVPYSRDISWDEIFLPNNVKTDIQKTVDVFLNSKQWYEDNKIPWKTGAFLYGGQGNGKTSIIRAIIANTNFKPVTISSQGTTEDVAEAFDYAESQSPSFLFFEDFDSKVAAGQIDLSAFLNLMDGVSSKNGLFIVATANNPEILPSNLIDRPSRFDRKFLIPPPNNELTKKYLKRWFGKMVTSAFLTKLVRSCMKEKFTYAYLKELYVASMYNAIAKNRKSPNHDDINIALDRIIKERLQVGSDGIVDVNGYLNRNNEVS